MADQPLTDPTEPVQEPSTVPGREGPSVQDVNLPTNPGKETEKAAEISIEASKKRDFTQSVEKGSDKAFNTFVRRAHEFGNPEQLTPMQEEQRIRDMGGDKPTVSKNHDMSHEDTRWVVEHGIAS